MTQERFGKRGIYLVLIVTALVMGQLFWEYSTGGVLSHHLFASADYPAMSNWWAIVILPLLAWVAVTRVKKRLVKQSEEQGNGARAFRAVLIGFFLMLVISVAQSIAFTFGYQDVTKYLALAVLVSGLVLPIYRSECILGHVLGAVFTFGPIIPLIGMTVMATISAVSNLGIKPLVLKLLRRIKVKLSGASCLLGMVLIVLVGYGGPVRSEDLSTFCERLPRPAYAAFEKHPASNDWFEVYEVAPGVFAIYEPFQWQEVISYLIIGRDWSLLFDTGNGIGNIRAITDQLTGLPVTVLNSHSHYDHVGGNYQYERILAPDHPYAIDHSFGYAHDEVAIEVSEEALCHGLPEGVEAETHHIKPYGNVGHVADGDVIDLGGRELEVLQIPGHTPDALALLDRSAGFLWTGDSFYEGPIWLFMPETDVAAYRASLARLAALAPKLKALFPAHNTPKAAPDVLPRVRAAFEKVLAGEAPSQPSFEGTVTYDFEGFGFLMRPDFPGPPEG